MRENHLFLAAALRLSSASMKSRTPAPGAEPRYGGSSLPSSSEPFGAPSGKLPRFLTARSSFEMSLPRCARSSMPLTKMISFVLILLISKECPLTETWRSWGASVPSGLIQWPAFLFKPLAAFLALVRRARIRSSRKTNRRPSRRGMAVSTDGKAVLANRIIGLQST